MYEMARRNSGVKSNILRDIAVVEVFFATGARVYEVANIKTKKI